MLDLSTHAPASAPAPVPGIIQEPADAAPGESSQDAPDTPH